MDINAIKYKSIDAVLKGIAQRLKARRLEKNLSQKDFAKRAGVGYDAYLRFEKTGEISLRNLVLCAVALDDSEMFNALFNKQSYSSIDEILAEKKQAKRQRALHENERDSSTRNMDASAKSRKNGFDFRLPLCL